MITKHSLVVLICGLAAVLGSGQSFAAQQYMQKLMWGKVTRINDGDTIAIKNDDGKSVRVQLAYIDAPDMDNKTGHVQAMHRESLQALEKMILNKEVIVESLGVDQFNRIDGIVYLDKINVNLEMVRIGMAEVYHPVRITPERYDPAYVDRFNAAEKNAKENKRGIWGTPDYISPYQFRRRKRP